MPMTAVGLTELRAKLGGFPVELQAELRPALDEIGDLVGAEVRANASFSSKLPSQEFHKPSFSANAGEVVGLHPGVYPHEAEARVMEGDGYGGEFRHPVYGNEDVWRDQESHPMIRPAVETTRSQWKPILTAAVHKALN